MRIAQLANFHSPGSGGLRVSVDRLGAAYVQAGHQRLLIAPGPVEDNGRGEHRTVVRVPSIDIPRTPYRLIVRRKPVLEALEAFGPTQVEVSDKATLRWVGDWARDNGIRSVLVSHERVDAVARTRHLGPAARLATRWTARWAGAFDEVVVPSRFAAEEFGAVGADAHVVPWGVDLELFRPVGGPPPGALRLVWLGRLSAEKQPQLAPEVVRELVRRGVDVRLTIIGDGTQRASLERRAAGLPVVFTGRIDDPTAVAAQLARHHVALVTGSAETFGLAGLEALACGVPVVCPDQGGTQELLDDRCGRAVAGDPVAFADAVLALHSAGASARVAARRRATRFGWCAASSRMLAIHDAAELAA